MKNTIYVLVFISLGFLSGSSASSTLSEQKSYAIAACEEDECEFGNSCETNTGQNTQCNLGPDGCKTRACELEQENR